MVLTFLNLLEHGSPDDTANKQRLLRDTLCEFFATAVFVFNGTLSAVSTGRKLAGQGSAEDVARIMPIAFSFGISIMTLAYGIGHISGGHMNPAVSLLMFFRREMSMTKMLCYWMGQFIGAVLGSSLMWGCVNNLAGEQKLDGTFHRPPFELGATTVDASLNTGNAFLIEFMGSFFFFLIIAQTALDKRGIANSMFPAIPIGFSLIVVHICLIPFTGCGVNPARTFGPSAVVCMAGGECSTVIGEWYWVYYIAPFCAALAVSEVTLLMDMDIKEDNVDAQTIGNSTNLPGNQALDILRNVQKTYESTKNLNEVQGIGIEPSDTVETA